ncbi:MAG: hypothetical protein LBH40_04075 [Alphaproteobacteria bacterium]|jgi:hypothetical protein|nr:hypothetical protein [Alphaproteobacteria bacterium]
MSLGLKKKKKRDRDGFAIRTPENRELALSMWDSWLATAYTDNPKELTDEEVEFIIENSSIDDREKTKEFKKLDSWYHGSLKNHDSDLYKYWKEVNDLILFKHHEGIALTEEEIYRYNNFYCPPYEALTRLSKFKKGGLRNNDYHTRDRSFGSFLKYKEKEKEVKYA